jgi:pyruvate dehydrogenase E1 component alpha subunit
MLGAPVLFVVENNLFASHMQIRLRQPLNATARFAVANDIAFEIVDGNDVIAVSAAAARLVTRARGGGGPGFLEAVTFRWYGHVDWREDIDVGVDRSTEDLANWRARDPVARLTTALEREGLWSPPRQTALAGELSRVIADAWEQAMKDPWPTADVLLGSVYSNGAGR